MASTFRPEDDPSHTLIGAFLMRVTPLQLRIITTTRADNAALDTAASHSDHSSRRGVSPPVRSDALPCPIATLLHQYQTCRLPLHLTPLLTVRQRLLGPVLATLCSVLPCPCISFNNPVLVSQCIRMDLMLSLVCSRRLKLVCFYFFS